MEAHLDTALSAAELGAEAETAVEIGVGQGRIAWIPESQICVGTWDVTGHVLENLTTGAAEYLETYERILEPLDVNLVIHSPTDLDVIAAPTAVVAAIEGEAVDSWTLAYDALGGLLRATDGTGHSVRFERDALGRVTRRILADGSSEVG